MPQINQTIAPFVLCLCGREFQVADSGDVGFGAERTCPDCGRTMRCIRVERVTEWTWKFAPKVEGRPK